MTDIPQEWVNRASMAFEVSYHDEGNGIDESVKAALAAVIPLIREDERERLAKIADDLCATVERADPDDGGVFEPLSDWLRAQGRE